MSSALETFVIIALYKSTFTITITITIYRHGMLQDRRLVGWDSTAISTQIWLHRAITALIYKLVRGAARRKPDRRPQSADQKTNCPQCRIEVRPTACYHPCSSVHSFVRIHILKTDAPQLKHDGGLLTLNLTLTRSLPTLYMTLTFPGDS